MDVHIGNLIESKMKELHINNAELALRIQMGRMNVHSIVRRKTLKADLLEKISRALNYDFFRYYSLPTMQKKTLSLSDNFSVDN